MRSEIRNELLKREQESVDFVKKLTGKTNLNALESMARPLARALIIHEINFDDFHADYNADKICTPSCLIEHGSNVFDAFDPKYRGWAEAMFKECPTGLGTPNAAIGRGEFLMFSASPSIKLSKKKNEGDLLLVQNGKESKIEIKGKDPRFFANISGKEFHAHVAMEAKKFGFLPNTNRSEKLPVAYEPWSKSKNKKDHWQKEFQKMGTTKSKEFLTAVCKIIDPNFSDQLISSCFSDGLYSPKSLQKLFLKMMFPKDCKWNYLTIISDNGSIKCLNNSQDKFEKLVDDNKIQIGQDYIRVAQSFSIGLYFNFA